MTARSIAEKMGGRRTLARDVKSDLDLADIIHGGIPVGAVDEVLASGLLSHSELYQLVVPRRTLSHRREKQKTLTPEQSDRLARVVRVVARAEEALGDPDKAARWLRMGNRALNSNLPIDLTGSDIGSRLVERILTRIEHGVVS